MVNNTTAVRASAVSITGLLGLLFVGLKLGNVITWSWLWVLAPFWVPFALLLVFLVLGFVFAVIMYRLERRHGG